MVTHVTLHKPCDQENYYVVTVKHKNWTLYKNDVKPVKILKWNRDNGLMETGPCKMFLSNSLKINPIEAVKGNVERTFAWVSITRKPRRLLVLLQALTTALGPQGADRRRTGLTNPPRDRNKLNNCFPTSLFHVRRIESEQCLIQPNLEVVADRITSYMNEKDVIWVTDCVPIHYKPKASVKSWLLCNKAPIAIDRTSWELWPKWNNA